MTINMSYCRFQNTLLAVKECAGDLGDMIEGRGEPLSREERNAAVRLAEEMISFLQMLDETSLDGLSDDPDTQVCELDCSDERIEAAIATICEMAGSEDDEDDE